MARKRTLVCASLPQAVLGKAKAVYHPLVTPAVLYCETLLSKRLLHQTELGCSAVCPFQTPSLALRLLSIFHHKSSPRAHADFFPPATSSPETTSCILWTASISVPSLHPTPLKALLQLSPASLRLCRRSHPGISRQHCRHRLASTSPINVQVLSTISGAAWKRSRQLLVWPRGLPRVRFTITREPCPPTTFKVRALPLLCSRDSTNSTKLLLAALCLKLAPTIAFSQLAAASERWR
jgi:hypothetical protein